MASDPPGDPDLSVVIPTLGRATLDEQLEALARCRWDRPWEVVLADNAGDGAVAAAVDRWRDRVPGLRAVDASDRRGRSHAVNVGAEAARGRWLLYVDDDDLVVPEIVAAVGDAFVDGARVVVFNLNIHEINPRPVWASLAQAQLTEHGRPMFRKIPAVWGCAGIERSLFLELGGFDEDQPYAEDLDFTVRLHEATGIEPTWLPRQLIHYRLRGDLAGRFRTRVQVAHAIDGIARRHPDLIARPAGSRGRTLVAGLARTLRYLPPAVTRTGRLALADRLGDVWGQFTARGRPA